MNFKLGLSWQKISFRNLTARGLPSLWQCLTRKLIMLSGPEIQTRHLHVFWISKISFLVFIFFYISLRSICLHHWPIIRYIHICFNSTPLWIKYYIVAFIYVSVQNRKIWLLCYLICTLLFIYIPLITWYNINHSLIISVFIIQYPIYLLQSRFRCLLVAIPWLWARPISYSTQLFSPFVYS